MRKRGCDHAPIQLECTSIRQALNRNVSGVFALVGCSETLSGTVGTLTLGGLARERRLHRAWHRAAATMLCMRHVPLDALC